MSQGDKMELKEQAKQIALKHAEEMMKELVDVCMEPALIEAKEAIKQAIPGQIDDAVLEVMFAALMDPAKAALKAQIEKIHA